MSYYRILRLHLLFIISCSALLVSCSSTIPQSEADNLATDQSVSTSSIQNGEGGISTQTPTTLSIVEQTATHTPTDVAEKITPDEPSPVPITPSATATMPPIMTNTPTPSPTTETVACDNTLSLPEKAFPADIDMESSYVAVHESFVYIAVEQDIGIFDISDPISPKFLGFWKLSDLPEISGIKIQNGLAYVVGGSTLHVMNLSPECRFATINRVNMPFQIFHLEIEGNRLYIGGASEDQGQRQLTVLSLDVPSRPEELSIVDLGQEPTVWSIFEEKLYSLRGEQLFITDLSDLNIVQNQSVNITLDSESLSYSWITLFKDTLYLFSESDGLSIISNLQEETPNTIRNQQQYILIRGDFEVQGNYIFLSNNSCDGIDCGSVAWILDADDGKELSFFGLYPHYPVYKYREIQDSLIYAFSNDSLIVIDVSNIDNPVIVDGVPLIGSD